MNDTHYIRNAIYLFCGVNKGYITYPLLYNQEDYEKFNKLYQAIEDEFNTWSLEWKGYVDFHNDNPEKL